MINYVIGFILAFVYFMSNIKLKVNGNFYYKSEFDVYFRKC